MPEVPDGNLADGASQWTACGLGAEQFLHLGDLDRLDLLGEGDRVRVRAAQFQRLDRLGGVLTTTRSENTRA